MRRLPEGILYICYRASCGERGFVSSVGTIFPSAGNFLKRKESNPYTRPLQRLNAGTRRFFLQKFGLRSSEIQQFRWAPADGKVAMPILDFRGYEIGNVLRLYPELCIEQRQKPRKAISYWNSTSIPTLHFQTFKHDVRSIVLVEDIISAIKIGRHRNCVALLGSHLSEKNAQHLLDLGICEVNVALDADAWDKAVKMKRQYSVLFRTFNVLTWENKRDPKDQSDEELLEWL